MPSAGVVLYGAGEGLETAGSAPTQEDGDTDSMAQANRARQKAFGRLDTYLDENGGINDPNKAGWLTNCHLMCNQAIGIACPSPWVVHVTVCHDWDGSLSGCVTGWVCVGGWQSARAKAVMNA